MRISSRQCGIANRFIRMAALVAAVLIAVRPAQAAKKVFTEADQGVTVQLKPGGKVEVRLYSNPTTGFRWFVAQEPAAPVELLKQWNSKSESGLMGAPSYQNFLFRAVGRGKGVLRLHYVRSWEPVNSNERRFELQIVVN